jgi:heme exporter protein D
MMPDLGKYAEAVLSSYIVSIVLLVLLVAMSLRASKKARAELQKLEDRRRG